MGGTFGKRTPHTPVRAVFGEDVAELEKPYRQATQGTDLSTLLAEIDDGPSRS